MRYFGPSLREPLGMVIGLESGLPPSPPRLTVWLADSVQDALVCSALHDRPAFSIWAKERLVIGRGDYHWQHEPCFYAVRNKGNWTGDRKQTTLWTIPSRDQDAETVHGTQKPVECMRRPMLNNSSPGQAVYEPFLGSGTTLIAAQTTGRVCYAIEIDPLYVDVAIRRWQAFTGKTATLSGDGRSFEEIASDRASSQVAEPAYAERSPALPDAACAEA